MNIEQKPRGKKLQRALLLCRAAYLEVVRAHEQVGNALSHNAHDPLVKVLGLALGGCVCNLSLYQPSQTVDLQHRPAGVSQTGAVEASVNGTNSVRNPRVIAIQRDAVLHASKVVGHA